MLTDADRDLLARCLAELAMGHGPERVTLRRELVARLARDDREQAAAAGEDGLMLACGGR